MKYIKDKKLIIMIILIFMIISLLFLIAVKKDNKKISTNELVFDETTTNVNIITKIYVDIKGEVKSPGVYEFKENDRVIDAIKTAGGLTKKASTNNINLSQKLKNEMVIYVSNKNELRNSNICSETCKTEIIEVDNCSEVKSSASNLININEASKEELMTIDSIGESKAENIIKYREDNGLFKSVDDIKNVTGIGDAIFNSIKEKITI